MKRRYICPEKYAWRKMENEVVILDVPSGDFFVLNETASIIWEALMTQEEPEEISQRITEEFTIPANLALQEINEVLHRFKKDGFLLEDF